MDTNKKVWFITGASKGFGLIFIRQLLEKGEKVAATSRNLEHLKAAAATDAENFLPLQMDLANEQSVALAIKATLEKFGRIDNVVNNAGYGQIGSIEELTDAEVRQNFEVNVYGSLNVIRQVLPHLRKQKSGHIFNFSSVAGLIGNFPGFGIYCATKFAVNGFTEALAVEAKPFGINVTLVMPGYFRTNFLEQDSIASPKNVIEAYTTVRESQEIHKNQIRGNQPGDPEKGVKAVLQVAEAENPPLYLLLGSDAYEMANNKADLYKNEFMEWGAVTKSTDY